MWICVFVIFKLIMLLCDDEIDRTEKRERDTRDTTYNYCVLFCFAAIIIGQLTISLFLLSYVSYTVRSYVIRKRKKIVFILVLYAFVSCAYIFVPSTHYLHVHTSKTVLLFLSIEFDEVVDRLDTGHSKYR